jgi:hypothetical protein
MENFMCSIRRRILPNLIEKVPSQVNVLELGVFVEYPSIHVHFIEIRITQFLG